MAEGTLIYLDDIKDRVSACATEARSKQLDLADRVGILRITPVNETISKAKLEADPVMIWGPFWYEGECCIFFADTNIGKSILAVQIAEDIAKSGKRVLIFDFEHTSKQFQLRYTDLHTGETHKFPDEFMRAEIDLDNLDADRMTDQVMDTLEEIADKDLFDVLIVDNITFLCINAEKSDEMTRLMQRFSNLKKRKAKEGKKISVMIIAHTPKRPLCLPLSINDLAGSKKLSIFADSVFAMGKSAKDINTVYLKQLKTRNDKIIHGVDNVKLFTREKVGSMLRFVEQNPSVDNEMNLLDNSSLAKTEAVKELTAEGRSCRDIARVTGMSKSAVNNIQHK